MDVGGQHHAPAALPPVKEAGWAPGPVWTDAENLASIGIRSRDRPARRSVAIPTELSRPLFEGMSGRKIEIKFI